MQLTVTSSEMGRVVVVDQDAGHEFAFRVETARGQQVLEAFAPKWNGGEPPDAKGYTIPAHDLARQEAVDQGWIGL